MGFEYDPDKSAENKRKHGIDFEAVQKLWADAGLVEIPARTTDEPRWLLIGKIDEKHWSVIITRRGERPLRDGGVAFRYQPVRRFGYRGASATGIVERLADRGHARCAAFDGTAQLSDRERLGRSLGPEIIVFHG